MESNMRTNTKVTGTITITSEYDTPQIHVIDTIICPEQDNQEAVLMIHAIPSPEGGYACRGFSVGQMAPMMHGVSALLLSLPEDLRRNVIIDIICRDMFSAKDKGE